MDKRVEMELRESLFSLIDGEFLYARPWYAANKTDASSEVKMKAGQQMSGAQAHTHSSTDAAEVGRSPSEWHSGLQQRSGAGLQLERCAVKLIPTKRRKKISVARAQHCRHVAERVVEALCRGFWSFCVCYIPCGSDRFHRRDHHT